MTIEETGREGTGPATLGVREGSLTLPDGLDADGIYDVLINGDHVWSLKPSRDAARRGNRLVARWPKALKRYLVGRARVTLRQHAADDVLAVGEHVFGGEPDREVRVADKSGNVLVLDKYGRLIRPLSAEAASSLDTLLDQTEQLLGDLREKAGVPAFIAYGTLLGAVRNGELIGHDNDLDLGYVSEHAYPVDVIREGYRVERALQKAGWTVRRGSGTRLNVRIRQPDGRLRFVDVFTAHWVDDVLYMPSDTGFRLPREAVLPLTSVELHGRRMPAPADHERLLAATYGEGWRSPDPSFQYETPRWLARRLNGWFGGLRTRRKVWDTFYAGAGRNLTQEPSPFAEWVTEHYPSSRPLLDVGTGNGRDALWFAGQGRPVTAVDYMISVLDRASRRAEDLGLPASFATVNCYDSREMLALGTRLSRADGPVDVYARFMLHALEEPGRDNLVRLASMVLRQGGHLFLEFRTRTDALNRHHFKQPRRMYVRPADARALVERHGGRVVEQVTGKGLAPLLDEDPNVCRIVATWT
jgi:SAM-dependent methyltransferase